MTSVSIEVGHFYADAIRQGPERLAEIFTLIKPWAQLAAELTPDSRTVFMVDDYHNRPGVGPEQVIPQILEGANMAGVKIDYLAREAACVRVADFVLARLIERSKMLNKWALNQRLSTPDMSEPLTEQGLVIPETEGWLADRTLYGTFGPGVTPCRCTDIPAVYARNV